MDIDEIMDGKATHCERCKAERQDGFIYNPDTKQWFCIDCIKQTEISNKFLMDIIQDGVIKFSHCLDDSIAIEAIKDKDEKEQFIKHLKRFNEIQERMLKQIEG